MTSSVPLVIEIDRTYTLRNGKRVYISQHHSYNPEIMIGYGEDGIYHHFDRADGKSRLCFGYSGGPVLNDPQIDIVCDSMGIDDLKDECIAYKRHTEEQRAYWNEVSDLPNGGDLYETWNRQHRPPGPLRPGMKESDYDL